MSGSAHFRSARAGSSPDDGFIMLMMLRSKDGLCQTGVDRVAAPNSATQSLMNKLILIF